uniref:Sushi domain-containing protein n=1 Tax=Cyprinus carpio TaxID=7962 RepID=A0A8C1RS86_CYPCA
IGDKKLGAKKPYRCESGYRETAAEATCTRDGWTPKPLCAEIVYEEPNIPNAEITGETADVECDPGFISNERFIKCINGNWEKPVCKEGVPCGIPPNVKNAVITSKPEEFYPDGSSLTYECQSPYSISGERTVSCRNGTWEKTPTCQGEVLLKSFKTFYRF